MNKYYYHKQKKINTRKLIRISGLIISLTGLCFLLYFLSPLLLWEMYTKQALASGMTIPIPKATVLTRANIQSLLTATAGSLSTDYTDASNWYPTYHENKVTTKISSYLLTIPRLKITNAVVSTVDYDLAKHLVHFGGTAIPPEKGNAVIFGHSTLPQLYNSNDYKTIFANVHTLKTGDDLQVTSKGVTYTYKIISIIVVNPEDTSVLQQDFDDSYLTIITCTPPGTIWKRLVIKARMEKI